MEERCYKSILLAVDASDLSNRGVLEAIDLATLWDAKITAAHVYAAKLHDQRFRQMEGGLPERYKVEEELEKQRDIHAELITKGLGAITDSYLEQVATLCKERGVQYASRSLEGKNYAELTLEANSGEYDLLVMGASGLGAIAGGRLGTVCERLARRAQIDLLVIKDQKRPLAEGPIVTAVDGSTRSYAGLLLAMTLGEQWKVPVHAVAAHDPDYHYVAFNKIADVLTDEARKIFRFEEQERLHEEIIDEGLAKIYQGHLDVATALAEERDFKLSSSLLAGKPYQAIGEFVQRINPSLLIMGSLGIHADEGLDIGGQAERLLRESACAVLLCRQEYTPAVDLLAEATVSWTEEALARMDKIPAFVRRMARLAVLRHAQQQGHTVITEKIIEEATARFHPPGDKPQR
jgi:nucleotide-binding universal stress UspA family protein